MRDCCNCGDECGRTAATEGAGGVRRDCCTAGEGLEQARGCGRCGEGLGEGGGCERLRRCGERTGAGMLRPLLHCCEWGGWGVVLGCCTGEQKGVRRRVNRA